MSEPRPDEPSKDSAAQSLLPPLPAHPEPHPARKGLMIFCPHELVTEVSQVNPLALRARGLTGVILDLDNTLVLWKQEVMDDEVVGWLAALKAAEVQICILSNSFLSNRSQRVAERLGCHFVRQARKPSRVGFRRAMSLMGTRPATTAMVGDQMFTDIWGGNRSGLYTIMVNPLHRHEFAYTRYVSRPPERLLMEFFRRGGFLPPGDKE